jgi:hypothetical protein
MGRRGLTASSTPFESTAATVQVIPMATAGPAAAPSSAGNPPTGTEVSDVSHPQYGSPVGVRRKTS